MESQRIKNVDVNFFLPIEEVEPGAMEQIVATASHPHAYKQLAVMPDCHQGYGVTIGSVFATEGVIVPNAVGVDIGCGVAVAATGIRNTFDAAFWERFQTKLAETVPVGWRMFTEEQEWSQWEHPGFLDDQRVMHRAKLQLGTLGGGNHFLEVAQDGNGLIFFLVHSGSRHFGHTVATKYQQHAMSESPRDPVDLESLRDDSELGRLYLRDMSLASAYASTSRQRMIEDMWDTFWASQRDGHLIEMDGASWNQDVCHNYVVEIEDGIWLHRKGAVDASKGVFGVIPGSMGTPTYLVRGRGNLASWMSCSHGAGRVMGRNAAKRTYTMDQFAEAMEGTFSKITPGMLDESPMAYKSIDTVIDRQTDCIEVVNKLMPILTLKGGGRDEG